MVCGATSGRHHPAARWEVGRHGQSSVCEGLRPCRMRGPVGPVDQVHPNPGVRRRVGEQHAGGDVYSIAWRRRRAARRTAPDPGHRVCDCAQRVGDQRLAAPDDALVACLGLAMHPGDRAAGQNVMELEGERLLPQFVQLCCRVGVAGAAPCGCQRPPLHLSQQGLASAIACLGFGLGRVGGPVHLQVQLTHPAWRIRQLGQRLGEELGGRADRHPGDRLTIGGDARPGHHLAGGTASTVAVTKGHQRGVGHRPFCERAGGGHQLTWVDLSVVGVDGRKVGGQRCAVQPLPQEGVMREGVGAVP